MPINSGLSWTEEELQYLRDNYTNGEVTVEAIANHLERSTTACITMAGVQHVRRGRNPYCWRGHKKVGDNIRQTKRAAECRTCAREYNNEYKKRRRAKGLPT